MAVQGPRHQFLPGTGFTVDQHRDLGAGQAADGPEDLLHGWGLTDDLGAAGHRFHWGSGLPGLMTTGAADLGDGLVEIEGLRQILEGATMKGGYGAVQIRVSGHDDDGQARIAGRDLRQQFEAINTRHADVREDDVGPVPLQGRHDATTVDKAGDIHLGLAQGPLQDPAN